ncbi:MAG: DUF488 domain-containing protein [bacterium]|nr:DUF488 domain-containing protein [Acidimicrobiia bacterium]MCY4649657.1 DUF488 domain-containing protein [bacterium]
MVNVTEDEFAGRQDTGLFSIGHSNHRFEELVRLLGEHRVQAVADVRTSPYSRYNPQFNSRDLRYGLEGTGIRYVFLGKELGGRPEGARFYDTDGHVHYGRVAETQWFQTGLDRLCDGARRFRTAILCSEEDPAECHRFLLITRALDDRGVEVTHIRGDGAVQGTKEISAFDAEHKVVSLFGEDVRSSWRSTRSVLPKGRLKTSSNR